jgi:hypothetical protein
MQWMGGIKPFWPLLQLVGALKIQSTPYIYHAHNSLDHPEKLSSLLNFQLKNVMVILP